MEVNFSIALPFQFRNPKDQNNVQYVAPFLAAKHMMNGIRLFEVTKQEESYQQHTINTYVFPSNILQFCLCSKVTKKKKKQSKSVFKLFVITEDGNCYCFDNLSHSDSSSQKEAKNAILTIKSKKRSASQMAVEEDSHAESKKSKISSSPTASSALKITSFQPLLKLKPKINVENFRIGRCDWQHLSFLKHATISDHNLLFLLGCSSLNKPTIGWFYFDFDSTTNDFLLHSESLEIPTEEKDLGNMNCCHILNELHSAHYQLLNCNTLSTNCVFFVGFSNGAILQITLFVNTDHLMVQQTSIIYHLQEPVVFIDHSVPLDTHCCIYFQGEQGASNMLVWQMIENDKKEKSPFLFSKQFSLKQLLDLNQANSILSSHFLDHSTLCIITNTSKISITKFKLGTAQFCTAEYPFEFFVTLQKDEQTHFIPLATHLLSTTAQQIQLLTIPTSKEAFSNSAPYFALSNEFVQSKMRQTLQQLDSLSKTYESKQFELKMQNERIKCIAQSTQLYKLISQNKELMELHCKYTWDSFSICPTIEFQLTNHCNLPLQNWFLIFKFEHSQCYECYSTLLQCLYPQQRITGKIQLTKMNLSSFVIPLSFEVFLVFTPDSLLQHAKEHCLGICIKQGKFTMLHCCSIPQQMLNFVTQHSFFYETNALRMARFSERNQIYRLCNAQLFVSDEQVMHSIKLNIPISISSLTQFLSNYEKEIIIPTNGSTSLMQFITPLNEIIQLQLIQQKGLNSVVPISLLQIQTKQLITLCAIKSALIELLLQHIQKNEIFSNRMDLQLVYVNHTTVFYKELMKQVETVMMQLQDVMQKRTMKNISIQQMQQATEEVLKNVMSILKQRNTFTV